MAEQGLRAPKTVIVHEPGEFTGDVSHLTGNPSVVSSAVGEGAMAVQFVHEYFREM